MADAGWYPDAHDPGAQHYFDGQNWTGQRRPVPAAPADQTVRRGDLPDAGGSPEPQGQQWQQPADQSQPVQQQWQPQDQQQWQPQDQQQWQPHDQQQWAPHDQQQWAPHDQQQWGPHDQQQWQPHDQQQWAPHDQQQWAPQDQQAWAPATAPRRRRGPLVLAGAAAAVVVAGVVTWLVWPGDDAPELTYRGKEIANASDTLTQAEKTLAASVRSRHGAKNGDTRCYFARPKKPASGAKKSDIAESLRCGPVLFIDGERTAAYLSVPFTESTEGGKAKLSVGDDLDGRDPAGLDDAYDMVRPDGKSVPTGNDGAGSLTVPEPPAAQQNVLTTAALGSGTTTSDPNVVLVGKGVSVTLDKFAEVKRYGSGDEARSTPADQQLYAMKVTYGEGDVDGTGKTALALVVDGGAPRALPEASGDDYVIAAVPTSGKASLVLTDGGVTQSISLPDAKAGSDVIALFGRKTRTTVLTTRVNVPIGLSQGSKRGSVTFKAYATIASLDYWAPSNPAVHASNPGNALLSVKLSYTSSIEPGKTFGFEPEYLTLKAGGATYKARNIAPKGKISDVFEVPWTFTSGQLVIDGATKVGGITLRVKTPKALSIQIAGG